MREYLPQVVDVVCVTYVLGELKRNIFYRHAIEADKVLARLQRRIPIRETSRVNLVCSTYRAYELVRRTELDLADMQIEYARSQSR